MGNSEEKEMAKSVFNNIIQPKSLPRVEAIRRYHSLSSEAKEVVNGWVDNRYSFLSEIPDHMKNVKLDINNPQHKKYIELWLKQRDHVLAIWSNPEWEKLAQSAPRRLIEIAPTPKEVLIKSQGILEQRLDGKGFKKYVHNRLQEANIYARTSNDEYKVVEQRIERMIVRKLLENPAWIQNTLSTREGRDAFDIISSPWLDARSILGDTEDAHEINEIIESHRGDFKADEHARVQVFKVGFLKIAEQVRKKLENQGSIKLAADR